MIKLKEIQKKVESRISEHIGFNVREILELDDYITIYGGAVRDSIADMEINDIDILCQSRSAEKLSLFLKEKYDYKFIDLYKKDTLNLYKNISIIAEPWSFISKDRKIIQIIRPIYPYVYSNNSDHITIRYTHYNLIKNVDLSNCGVFIDNDKGEIKLKESCKDGIIHCLTRTFNINNWSKLYETQRTLLRINKLENRGWENINGDEYDFNIGKISKQKEREIKLTKLKFAPEYDYKIWTDEEYENREFANKVNKNSNIDLDFSL